MFQAEPVTKGDNAYVQITTADGHSSWEPFKTPIAASEAATAISLGNDDAKTITLIEFWDRFMRYHAIPNLSRETVQGYHALFDQHIRSQLGATALTSINEADVLRLKDDLLDEGVTRSKANRTLDVLSAIFGIALKWRYVESNPVNSVEH